MVKLIVLFHRADIHTPEYGEQYNTFLMAVDKLPGLRRKTVANVYAGPGGFTPFQSVVEAYFDNHAAMQAALTSPPGVTAGKLLLGLAGGDAITMFAETMEESYPG